MLGLPLMLYRAIRRPDGRIVCLDVAHLHETTKVVHTEPDYTLAKSLGWCDHPSDAMARKEAEEDEISTNAGIRAYDDRHLSEAARAEVEAVERRTIRHLPEIPEGPKKRRDKSAGA